jgi:hypothetical protein
MAMTLLRLIYSAFSFVIENHYLGHTPQVLLHGWVGTASSAARPVDDDSDSEENDGGRALEMPLITERKKAQRRNANRNFNFHLNDADLGTAADNRGDEEELAAMEALLPEVEPEEANPFRTAPGAIMPDIDTTMGQQEDWELEADAPPSSMLCALTATDEVVMGNMLTDRRRRGTGQISAFAAAATAQEEHDIL